MSRSGERHRLNHISQYMCNSLTVYSLAFQRRYIIVVKRVKREQDFRIAEIGIDSAIRRQRSIPISVSSKFRPSDSKRPFPSDLERHTATRIPSFLRVFENEFSVRDSVSLFFHVYFSRAVLHPPRRLFFRKREHRTIASKICARNAPKRIRDARFPRGGTNRGIRIR